MDAPRNMIKNIAKKKVIYFIFCVFLVFGGLGCITTNAKKIKLNERVDIIAAQQSNYDEVRIAVAGVISPREAFIYYNDIIDYISEKLGKPVKLVQRETYQEINDLVKNEQVEVAFVCSGAYIEGHDKFGMELLVAPLIYGKAVYYSYIIVPADSPVNSLEELRGKKFAFTDPLSNSGRLAPTYMLAKMNETPASFFGMYIFTYNHDKSIEAVAEKLVDGAAVDSLIWDYLNETRPELTSKTKIIEISQPFGIPPVVVHRDLDPELKEKLKEIFLHMHEDEKGRQILEKVKIDRFIETDDRAYDSIREMWKFIETYE
jgi:phosphonate transport system substrate-binding protein